MTVITWGDVAFSMGVLVLWFLILLVLFRHTQVKKPENVERVPLSELTPWKHPGEIIWYGPTPNWTEIEEKFAAIPQRVVVCAANRYGDKIVLGIRHFDHHMHAQIGDSITLAFDHPPEEQGFVDQFGRFMDRKEALAVAEAAGQLNTRRKKNPPINLLFSEDLY